jgi:ABC-type transport system substrate-binding protein
LRFLALNTHRPLFRDARLRRAVNYAIDRSALAQLGSPYFTVPGQPTDQYLSPGIPGFRDVSIYPFTRDVVAARRLAQGKRGTAVLYTCNLSPCDRLAQIVKANLAAIGIEVTVKVFSQPTLDERVGRPGEPFDLAFQGWAVDYLDPSNMLNVPLEGEFLPKLDDPVYKRKLAAAARLSGPRRYLTYGKLDADLAWNAAPWVAYSTFATDDFFSARMGCQVFNPIYGMDIAALCLRKQS